MAISASRVNFPADWNQLTNAHLGGGALISMGMVRFYLLALKAAGYLNLRLQNWQPAFNMLTKVSELDESDQLGSTALLEIANHVYHSQHPQQVAI